MRYAFHFNLTCNLKADKRTIVIRFYIKHYFRNCFQYLMAKCNLLKLWTDKTEKNSMNLVFYNAVSVYLISICFRHQEQNLSEFGVLSKKKLISMNH